MTGSAQFSDRDSGIIHEGMMILPLALTALDDDHPPSHIIEQRLERLVELFSFSKHAILLAEQKAARMPLLVDLVNQYTLDTRAIRRIRAELKPILSGASLEERVEAYLQYVLKALDKIDERASKVESRVFRDYLFELAEAIARAIREDRVFFGPQISPNETVFLTALKGILFP
ncbi:MAG: hypothetical protein JW750_11755 [Anaerolineaceae bacterium]|nr:hypothetical protein [Anaerolineaceae bacterium]